MEREPAVVMGSWRGVDEAAAAAAAAAGGSKVDNDDECETGPRVREDRASGWVPHGVGRGRVKMKNKTVIRMCKD